jgi:GNAT superfamily N-acetyltransferase
LSYRIKRVDGTDDEIADTLRWMHTVCFAGTAPQVEPEKDYWWIAYLATEPCAFAALSELPHDKDAGYLKRAGVFREHRGNGLQQRLIRCREALARRFGWKILLTDTTNNIPSSNSLIRAGYRLYAPDYPWAFGQRSLYWRKDL